MSPVDGIVDTGMDGVLGPVVDTGMDKVMAPVIDTGMDSGMDAVAQKVIDNVIGDVMDDSHADVELIHSHEDVGMGIEVDENLGTPAKGEPKSESTSKTLGATIQPTLASIDGVSNTPSEKAGMGSDDNKLHHSPSDRGRMVAEKIRERKAAAAQQEAQRQASLSENKMGSIGRQWKHPVTRTAHDKAPVPMVHKGSDAHRAVYENEPSMVIADASHFRPSSMGNEKKGNQSKSTFENTPKPTDVDASAGKAMDKLSSGKATFENVPQERKVDAGYSSTVTKKDSKSTFENAPQASKVDASHNEARAPGVDKHTFENTPKTYKTSASYLGEKEKIETYMGVKDRWPGVQTKPSSSSHTSPAPPPVQPDASIDTNEQLESVEAGTDTIPTPTPPLIQ